MDLNLCDALMLVNVLGINVKVKMLSAIILNASG